MNKLIGTVFTIRITKTKECLKSNGKIERLPTIAIVTNYDNGIYTLRKLILCTKKNSTFQYLKIDHKIYSRCDRSFLLKGIYVRCNIIKRYLPIIYNPVICKLPDSDYHCYNRDMTSYINKTVNNPFHPKFKGSISITI